MKQKWKKAAATWRVMICNAQVKWHICIRFNAKRNKFDRIFCFLFVECWFSYPSNHRACECVAANGIKLFMKQHVNSHGCSRGMDSLTVGSVQTVWLPFALGFLKAGIFSTGIVQHFGRTNSRANRNECFMVEMLNVAPVSWWMS